MSRQAQLRAIINSKNHFKDSMLWTMSESN
nr:MAG TPA: hypothetical protein [Caudoviricetes sp.]